MNLAADMRNAALAWIGVGKYDSPTDAFERGYRAALRACGERTMEILDEHIEAEFADAQARGVAR
jgi:hypothetical protein